MKPSKEYLSIKDLENIPPLETNYALNSVEISHDVVLDIISDISPSSVNKYYDLNSKTFIEQAKNVLLDDESLNHLNIFFFKGIRESLAYLIKNLGISLVVFPRTSYPGNWQVCQYLDVGYIIYDNAEHLEFLLEKYDSSETIIVWEDPGNPEYRGNISLNKIKKSKVFIDCAYRFPSMKKEENLELRKYIKENFYIAFGFSKSVSLPGSSLSFIISYEKINNNCYPIKWNVFQASVAANVIRGDVIDKIYEEVYLKSIEIYREKEIYYSSQNIEIYSTLNPCFITIPESKKPSHGQIKMFNGRGLARLSLK